MANRDFHSLIWANFAHICRSTIQLNFAAILIETLVPSNIFSVGSWQISAYYGLCAVIPQVKNVYSDHTLAIPLINTQPAIFAQP